MNFVSAVLIAALASFPITMNADQPGTIGYTLNNGCSQAHAAFALDSAASDAFYASAIGHSERLFKMASGLWHACSIETSNGHAHDWALLLHDQDLLEAAKSNGDPWYSSACGQLNELAYATKYGDVRKKALHWKKLFC